MELLIKSKNRVFNFNEHLTSLEETNLIKSATTFSTNIDGFTFILHLPVEDVKYYNLAVSNYNKRSFGTLFKIVKSANGYAPNGVYFTKDNHYTLFFNDRYNADKEIILKDFINTLKYIKEHFETLNYIFGY